MYEERNGLSFKEIFIQLVLVILFVLIMIWLFPTKGFLDENYVENTDISGEISDALDEKLEALYGRLFADNIESMKIAGKDYFTIERLPKEVGDSVTITLDEMLDKKLILDLKDSNNESCDVDESYIKMTKLDDEYLMKIQLTCSDYADYINVYLGCYDYCDTDVCEPEKETPVTTNPTPTKPTPTKPTPEEPEPEKPEVKYTYEYRKEWGNEYSAWGNWSEWSTEHVSANNLRQVETKSDYVLINGDSDWDIVRYDTVEYEVLENQLKTREKTVEYKAGYNYIPIYENKTTTSTKLVDSYPKPSGSSNTSLVDSYTPKTTTSNGYYTSWKYSYTKSYTTYKYTSTTTQYQLVGTDYRIACDGCGLEKVYTYKVYTRAWVSGKTTTESCASGYVKENGKCNKYQTTTTSGSCPSGYVVENGMCNKYQTVTNTSKEFVRYEEQEVWKTKVVTESYWEQVPVTKTKQVPVMGYTDGEPYWELVKYYRYRTRTQTLFAGYDVQWSHDNDQSLLTTGYYKTGNKKEA